MTLIVYFAVQKVLDSEDHFLIVGLILELQVFCSEISFLCQWIQSFLLFFDVLYLRHVVLHWGSWSIWGWVLCRVIDKYLFLFFYTTIQCDWCLLLKISYLQYIFLSSLSKVMCLWVSTIMTKSSVWFNCLTSLLLSQKICHAIFITITLEYNLKSGNMIPPKIHLFFRIVLVILLCECMCTRAHFNMWLRFCLNFCEWFCWIFAGKCNEYKEFLS